MTQLTLFEDRDPVAWAIAARAASGHEERGAIFTRREVVEFILDLVGYTSDQPLQQRRLLEPGGRLAFICSDRWMKNRYGGPLRALVAPGYHLAAYVDTGRTLKCLSNSPITKLSPGRPCGAIAKPFVGWLMLLKDCPQSRTPVQDKSPHFPVFPE